MPLRRITQGGQKTSWRLASAGWQGAGGTSRAANTDEVRDLRREARDLKELEHIAENLNRHCEKRSDEAIQSRARLLWIASLRSQ